MTLSNPTKSPITSFIKDDVIPEIKPALPDVFMKEKKKKEKSLTFTRLITLLAKTLLIKTKPQSFKDNFFSFYNRLKS